ncbi:hypothetical protein IWQ60_002683 [Tieghemiomyces parasiticus]|uniref:Ubiquitin-like domain-containing protein n=1 Tax=Tieghemiomyces parasiticus TaxID=78921 RepID=A0A9W8ABP1_9FUNG|nr:hypothetical protein IWQ60_002683 [Tieghemiomyces parasiticus]
MLEEPLAFSAFLLRLRGLPVVTPIRQHEDDPLNLNYPLPRCRFEEPEIPTTEESTRSSAAQTLRLPIKALKSGFTYDVPVDPLTPIAELKQRLAAQCGVGPDYQRLLLKGKALQDAGVVGDYNLSSDTVVTLMVRPGGPAPREYEEKAETEAVVPETAEPPMHTDDGKKTTTSQSTPSTTLDIRHLSAEALAKLGEPAFQEELRALLVAHDFAEADRDTLVRALARPGRT